MDETNKQLKFYTGTSLWSCGHTVEVTVKREEDRESQVYVKAQAKAWVKILEYINTKRTVRRIFETLEKDIE